MTVHGHIERVSDLSTEMRATLLSLMRVCYLDVQEEAFHRDLAEKDWVILLRDCREGGHELVGFSTLLHFPHCHEGRKVWIAFSGDTVIHPKAWGSEALPIEFGRLLLSIQDHHPGDPLYWLLISKGFRTYRFLPVFFLDFHPRWDRPVPESIRRLMDALGADRFGPAYEPSSGRIRASGGAQKLRAELGTPNTHLAVDPHVRFFLERNPGWARGDELLCLTRFEPDNLRPYIRRRLGVAGKGRTREPAP